MKARIQGVGHESSGSSATAFRKENERSAPVIARMVKASGIQPESQAWPPASAAKPLREHPRDWLGQTVGGVTLPQERGERRSRLGVVALTPV